MANNYIQSGNRIKIDSASGAVTVGTVVAQEGFTGVALTSADSGAAFWLGITGVWLIDVPASTVKGDYLAIPGANGAPTESVGPTVTRTPSNSNSLFGRALTDRGTPTTGKAYVLLGAQSANKASTQV